jgi:hypothetical protein
LYGKAIITTPLNISLDNFKESVNYELLSTRSSFLELPDKIESLLKDIFKVGNENKSGVITIYILKTTSKEYFLYSNNTFGCIFLERFT